MESEEKGMKRFETDKSRKQLARRLAAESFVLLENRNRCLPLEKGKLAFFGRAYRKPVLGGMGSGMSFRDREMPSIGNACEAAGLVPVGCLDDFYRETLKREKVYDPMKELALAGPLDEYPAARDFGFDKKGRKIFRFMEPMDWMQSKTAAGVLT